MIKIHIYTVPSEVNNVIISVISNSSILVVWDPPLYPNGILTNYGVIVFNRLTEFYLSDQINGSDTREILVTELGKCYSWYHHAHPLTIKGLTYYLFRTFRCIHCASFCINRSWKRQNLQVFSLYQTWR